MRPKLFALIAVSAFALVGCGAAEQAQPVDVEPSKSEAVVSTSQTKAENSAVQPSNPKTEPISEGAKHFVEFVGMRAENVGVTDIVNDKQLVKQFNKFCETGEPLKVSKAQELNESLEATSESAFCKMRD